MEAAAAIPSRAVLALVVISLISCVSLVFAGDIVHHDDVAPTRPGCDNNFVLVIIHLLLLLFFARELSLCAGWFICHAVYGDLCDCNSFLT